MLDAGTSLGPYRILAPLGRGGMGEVYRAVDTRLGREVAVKVIAARLADDPHGLARFQREARAVAALAHPNIVVLYDVGRHEGVSYAVTELLQGENLRARLAAAALSWREAVAIGAAVADGLAAAHARGIIHRDLKPENLFLTSDGRVKILDFGLARVDVATADTATRTHPIADTDPGTVMGTLGYMSPEQLRGARVDGRSDLFSLGCVLFELIAGRRPFPGATLAEAVAAVLIDEPPTLGGRGTAVPPDVGVVIGRCLAREPHDRFGSAADLAQALRDLLNESIAAPSVPPPVRPPRPAVRRRTAGLSLAVLPLTHPATDPEAEYLGDGITEGVIQALSQLPGLRVLARSTVFRYKGQAVDPREVGRTLRVRAVLTGQLYQRGGRVVLRAELVDVKDGTRLWGEQYDRAAGDVVLLETALAREIAAQLSLRLSSDQQRRLARPPTQSSAAYHCYLQGRHHWNKRSGEGLARSVQRFEEAIDLDPTFALAYAGLADTHLNLGGWGHRPFHEAYSRARAAASRALAIDDGLAEAHVSLAMVLKEYDWDWDGAGRSYARGLALNPNYAVGHQWHGEYLAALGRHDEAIAAFRRAVDLDPLSLIIQATLGRHGYHFARRCDEAVAQLKRTLEMDDRFWVAHLWLGWLYAQMGRHDEAFAELHAARRLDDNLEIDMALGYAHGRAGRPDDARRVLAGLTERAQTGYVSPMLPAVVLLGLGEHDAALGWLGRACDERAQMMSEINAEPAFDPLRSDPRFVDLLRRVGLAGGRP